MRHPALVPAIAVVAGAAPGCLRPWPAAAWLLVPLLALLAAAGLAWVRRAPQVLTAAVAAGFALAAFIGASCATLEALHPPIEARLAGVRGFVLLEGVLRQDASAVDGSVSLSLAARAVEIDGVRSATAGGVIVNVNGTLAAGRVPEWVAGRTVRMPAVLVDPASFRDPGVRDRAVALARRGTRYVGSVKSGALVEVVARGSALSETAARARRFARRAIGEAVGRWDPRSAAIVVAILIGDRVGLGEDVTRRLQEAGTYHVIAISGGNIAILVGILLGVFRLAGRGARVSLAVTMAGLAFYAYLVGGGPSVVRATIMAIGYLLARMGDHRTAPVNALAVSAGLIVMASPLSILDAGFALTFGATLGILVGAGRARDLAAGHAWLRAPAGLLLASCSAELALLPVSASAFSRVTFAGLLLNFVAIPLMSVAQVGGMLVLPLALVYRPAAYAAGYVAHLGAAGLVDSARAMEVLSWLACRVPAPAAAVIVVYYGAWAASFAAARWGAGACWRDVRLAVRLAAALAIVASTLWILISPAGRLRGSVRDGLLRVTFLDVGQADAILVRFPDARTLLVDTGGSRTGTFDVGGRVIMPALWALDVYALDVLALTHADPDHAGGALAILRDFPVGEVWDGVPVPRDPILQALHGEAARQRIRWRTVFDGARETFGGVDVRVWHPPPPDWERQKVRNDDSLVIELTRGRTSVLLTGDIGREVEQALVPRILPAAARVLKVPHHGSASSSSPGFLAAVRPEVAVFTVGRARPADPLDPVIARYRNAGARVFRTGDEGAVTVMTNGTAISVKTWREGGWRTVGR